MIMFSMAFSSATSVPGLNAEMQVGVARQRLPARIDHDQLGAVLLDGVLDEGRGHRMIHRRIGADHDDHLGIHRGRETAPTPRPELSPSISAATEEAWHSRVQ